MIWLTPTDKAWWLGWPLQTKHDDLVDPFRQSMMTWLTPSDKAWWLGWPPQTKHNDLVDPLRQSIMTWLTPSDKAWWLGWPLQTKHDDLVDPPQAKHDDLVDPFRQSMMTWLTPSDKAWWFCWPCQTKHDDLADPLRQSMTWLTPPRKPWWLGSLQQNATAQPVKNVDCNLACLVINAPGGSTVWWTGWTDLSEWPTWHAYDWLASVVRRNGHWMPPFLLLWRLVGWDFLVCFVCCWIFSSIANSC